MPGGGLALDGRRWVPCRERFSLPVRVLSRLFRYKFLSYLREAFDSDTLGFHGKLETLAQRRNWCRMLAKLEANDWVVYAKPPFGGPTQVLKYLARYTHRVAISNSRLVSVANGNVAFRWKDYSHGNRNRTMTLDAVEFTRRFLLHSLPKGFQRIRQYGFLANRVRQQKLSLCRELLSGAEADVMRARDAAGDETKTSGTAPDDQCPACHNGNMIVVAIIERLGPCRQTKPATKPWDTS